MKLCSICSKEAKADFNIELKRTPICESCANSITWQQMESLIREKNANISYQELVHGMTTKELPGNAGSTNTISGTTTFPVTKDERSGAIVGVAPKSDTLWEQLPHIMGNLWNLSEIERERCNWVDHYDIKQAWSILNDMTHRHSPEKI